MDMFNYSQYHWSWVEFCGSGNTSYDVLPIWNHVYKDVDLCFQYLCLQLPVLAIICIISSYYCGIHLTNVRRSRKEVWVLRVRSCVTLFLSALPVIKTYIEVYYYAGSLHAIDYLISAVECFTWLIHFTYLVALFNRLGRTLRGPTLLGILWSVNYIMCCISLHTNYVAYSLLDSTLVQSQLPVLFNAVQVGLHTIYLLTLLPSEDNNIIQNTSIQGEDSPLFGVYSRFSDDLEPSYLGVASGFNVLSGLTFSWVTPLLSNGKVGQLKTSEDLFDLPVSLSSSYLFMKLRHCLTEDSLYGTNRVTLLKALHCAFWKQFYGIGVLKLVADVAGFFNPLLLHSLVTFIQSPEEPIYYGYLYALGLCAVTFVNGVCIPHFNYLMTKVGLKIRGSLITTIYRKTLSVNSITLSQFSEGEILNLMSTDVDRIVNSCASFHSFWSIPFQLGVTLYLLYSQVGVSFIAGVLFSLLLIPINKTIANKIGSLSTSMMSKKDERLMLMTELLKGIKAVKFYVWEHIFVRKLDKIRSMELKYLGGRKYLDAMCVYFWATTPVLISILTFTIYVYTGHQLTAPTVFTTMALLNMLIAPLNSFPWVLNGLTEAWVSLKRVQRLIELPEQDLDVYYTSILPERESSSIVTNSSRDSKPGFIHISNAHFHWSDSASISLSNINLTVHQGQLVGITGTVGSGKSSLLSAILAEIEKTSGLVHIGDYESGFGYVSQTAWLQRGSIKSNILFGEAFDHNIYSKVIEACCLQEDLDTIPGGDEASVGEAGSTLSGGQKLRITLARACYKNHNIYLLDDVLSAVDSHVAHHIYTKCIHGLLKNKTRILCTHQNKYLLNADWVVVMNQGRITAQGVPSQVLPDYEELAANNELDIRDYSPSHTASDNKVSTADSTDKEIYQEEERATGSLETGVYSTYIAGVGLILTLFILLFVSLMQASKNALDYWLAYWVSSANTTNSTFPSNLITRSARLYTSELGVEESTKFYLSVYLGLAGANSILTLLRAFLFAYGGLVAARSIHSKLVNSIVWSKLSFFDITPVGRLLNRFSSDTYTIDDSLPFIINILLAQFFTLLGTLVMTLYSLPWLLLLLSPLVPVYHWIQNHYRITSREIKRLTSVSLSPLYNHFTETIHGLVTIRAFRSTSRFKRDNACYLETSQKTSLCASAVAQWLAFRLQMIGVVLVSGVGFLTVIQHHLDHAEPGLIGLALSYALTVTGSLGGVVNAFTETEREMVSVERVRQYIQQPVAKVKHGARLVLDNVPFGWPQFGVVSFNLVSLKYRSGGGNKMTPVMILMLLASAACGQDIKHSDSVGRFVDSTNDLAETEVEFVSMDNWIISKPCVIRPDNCHCDRINQTSTVLCCQILSQFLFTEGLACASKEPFNLTQVIIKNSNVDHLDIAILSHLELQELTFIDSSVNSLSGHFRSDSLNSVNLSSLGLKEIDQHTFMYLNNLVSLDLSNNNLIKLPELPHKGHNLTLDISNNTQLMCSAVKDLMTSWQNVNKTITFLNYNDSYCITSQSFNWFNSTDTVPLSQLEIMNKIDEDCPKGENWFCRCRASRWDMRAGQAPTVAVEVNCSNQRLTALPDKLPPNTYLLNVTNNFITSLDKLVNIPSYHNIREFLADNNNIESINILEGTHFIVNFKELSLRGNKLKNIPTYFLSSTFDRNLYSRRVYLSNNKLMCNCTTATALKTFLLTHSIHIPDYDEVLCDKDNKRVIYLKPEVMCVSYIPKKWTDYIYYIIAGELFLLFALASKVFYDYWVFKSTGSLPWPASRMPKLPCDWVFE